MRLVLPRPVLTCPGRTGPLLVTAVLASTLVPVLLATAPAATAAAAQPTAANTGVPAGLTLRRVDGMLLLDKANTTYSGLDVHGKVRVTAANVTLANSIVRGDNSTGVYGLVDANNPNSDHHGFVIRDTTIVPTYATAYAGAGIIGHDFTALRVEVTKTVDAVHISGNNVVVQASWLHDTTFVPKASNPFGSDSHNDGVQIVRGTGITVSGNTISGNSNSGLMVTQDEGVVSGVKFTGNWASGGACTVNIVATPRPTISGLTVTGNRFLHNTRNAACAILKNSGVTMTQSGNVWADTGAAVQLTRGR